MQKPHFYFFPMKYDGQFKIRQYCSQEQHCIEIKIISSQAEISSIEKSLPSKQFSIRGKLNI